MLSKFIKSKDLLNMQKNYIKNCAKHAAGTYKRLGLKFEMFEGTSMELSSLMCEGIYKELLTEMITENFLIGNKFGLTATIIPLQENETKRVFFNISLGIIFPN